MTLVRMRQARDVILERLEEERQDRILIQERATQAIMSAVFGAAGNATGVKAVADWRMFDTGEPVEKELPKTEQVASIFGGGEGMVSADEIYRLAAEIKAKEEAG